MRRLLAENNIDSSDIHGSGVGGRITREDIDAHIAKQASTIHKEGTDSSVALANRSEKRVPMTRLRKRIAERLLDAKNNTAMLTTFNEVDMSPIMQLRKTYGEKFE